MTENRALKAIVRERMARTNESYTTAHRIVTAGSARGLAGLTPGYPGFGAAAHGPSGQARHLLAQVGIDVSEPMACGLGGGIGFLYAVFEYASVPHPLLTIVAQHHPQPWLEAVAQHLGLGLTTVTSSKAEPALAKLDATIAAGSAAQLTVARGLLPWHPGVSELESADPYVIVVAGRDGDDYLVDDSAGQPHRVDAATLGAAWAAHRKGRFALTAIDRPPTAVDLAAAVRASIATTHAHLTGPVLGHSFDVNFGLSGMGKLADDLAGANAKTGWPTRFSSPLAFRTGSRRLAECLTFAHTAAGATRPLYAEFLDEAGAVAGLDLAEAAALARAAGEHWSALADLAGAVADDDDPLEMIALYAQLVAEVLPVEQRLADALGRAVGG